MAEVSIYVAAITAAAGVAGASISQIPIFVHDFRQTKQDRRERNAGAMRQACLELLDSVGNLETEVANAGQHRGEGMGAQLATIRKYAAAVKLNAASIELLKPQVLAAPADRLAKEAEKFAVAVVANENLNADQMLITTPDSGELDKAVEAFRVRAVAAADR